MEILPRTGRGTAVRAAPLPITSLLTTSVADRWNPKGSPSVVRAALHWRTQNHPKEDSGCCLDSPRLPFLRRLEIVVGRTQQRLRPSDVFAVADGDLSVPTIVGASEAVLERDGAQVLPVDVYAEAAPDTQMDVGNYRRLVAWGDRALE